MLIFEWTLVLLLAAIALSGIARRIGVPYPVFLALAGAAVAFLPNAPQLTLDPELALALFVAPVLLDAAYDTSLRDLKDNWLSVSTLVLVAVGLTTATVACVAHYFGGIAWTPAIALGAIVAPPDAAAATAVLRQVRLPHRIMVILEGESLLNDASALLIYRVAVGAAMTSAATAETLSLRHLAPMFLLATLGSLVGGVAAGWFVRWLLRRVRDVSSHIVLQFGCTFVIWILAERLHLSGILTVVAYGITVARTAPIDTPARIRIPAYAVWDLATFTLNVLAFLLIGLQLGPILDRLRGDGGRSASLALAGMVLAMVIVTRIGWVMSYNAIYRWKVRRWGERSLRPMMRPTLQSGVVISWCGMRGIVTLAAALALPDGESHGSTPFPHRDLIVLCAFAVVLGTLVIQGLTLKGLLRLFTLRDDRTVEREVDDARRSALQVALQTLDGDTSPEAQTLRQEYASLLQSAESAEDGHVPEQFPGDDLRRRVIDACRHRVDTLRQDGTIGDAAYHVVEEELDWLEMGAGGKVRRDS